MANIDVLKKQKTKFEYAINNHKQSIEEINFRLKKLTTKKQTIEHDMHDLTELINASSKGADKYETKIIKPLNKAITPYITEVLCCGCNL